MIINSNLYDALIDFRRLL